MPLGKQRNAYYQGIKEEEACPRLRFEYKFTIKIKVTLKLYRNRDPAMEAVSILDFEERSQELGHQSLVKEAARFKEEFGFSLQLSHPDPTCVSDSREVVLSQQVKTKLRNCLEVNSPGHRHFCLYDF